MAACRREVLPRRPQPCWARLHRVPTKEDSWRVVGWWLSPRLEVRQDGAGPRRRWVTLCNDLLKNILA